jgi:hypothetical protein
MASWKATWAMRRISAFAVHVGVVALTFAVFQYTHATRLTEVNASGQFTHDQDIQPGTISGFS